MVQPVSCCLGLQRKLAGAIGPDGAAFWAQQRDGQELWAVLEEPQQGMGVGVAGQVTDGEMGDMACVASHLSGRGHAQLSTASGPGGNPW